MKENYKEALIKTKYFLTKCHYSYNKIGCFFHFLFLRKTVLLISGYVAGHSNCWFHGIFFYLALHKFFYSNVNSLRSMALFSVKQFPEVPLEHNNSKPL